MFHSKMQCNYYLDIVCSQVVMAGDYILAVACMMLARLQNDDVTITMHQVY